MSKEREAFNEWLKHYNEHDVTVDQLQRAFMWQAWQAAKAQAVPEGFVLVPKEPTKAMLDSARDWSTKKYGKAVGNDGASGCYKAMIEAQEPTND